MVSIDMLAVIKAGCLSHEYVLRDGKWQHVDKLNHNTPAPSLKMTPEEKKQREALYQGG
ncbi:MAG: hypothetical protein IPJ12_14520 [Betaproteobacteria bacterium]|nr:hypothetical protein [Betaproteobacteria bacterium]